jgi:hypothetical protein
VAARLAFAVIAGFFVVMNVLLWRAEFGGRGTGSEVPPAAVFDRILTAPDPSALRVSRQGAEVGLLRWRPDVIEGSPAATNDLAPEGMIAQAAGYRLDLDFNLNGATPAERWRFLGQVELDTNRVWQTIQLRVLQRPVTWELTARAGTDAVHVRMDDGKVTRFEQTFSAADLQSLPLLLGSYASLLPKLPGVGGGKLDATRFQPELTWTARHDTLKLGNHRVRVYRLNARLLDRYEVTAHVSRAGELLLVTLPDQVRLVNDGVPGLK